MKVWGLRSRASGVGSTGKTWLLGEVTLSFGEHTSSPFTTTKNRTKWLALEIWLVGLRERPEDCVPKPTK